MIRYQSDKEKGTKVQTVSFRYESGLDNHKKMRFAK